MTKRELIIMVANRLDMSQSDVAKVVDEMIETVRRGLAEGQRWEFRGFGVLATKIRAPRKGRNPRTGEHVSVPARRVVTFHPGKQLAELLAAPTPQRMEQCEAETDRL